MNSDRNRTTGPASLLKELIDTCKELLSLAYQYSSTTVAETDIIRKAEKLIDRAERDSTKQNVISSAPAKKEYFGKIGKHYDFVVNITHIREDDREYRYEGTNRYMHRLCISDGSRKQKAGDTFEVGDKILFRGVIKKNEVDNGIPTIFVEITSGVSKV